MPYARARLFFAWAVSLSACDNPAALLRPGRSGGPEERDLRARHSAGLVAADVPHSGSDLLLVVVTLVGSLAVNALILKRLPGLRKAF